MAEIVLSTLNSRYVHASLGLRYLFANLGPAQSRAKMLEFTIHTPPMEMVERILDENPRVVGLGVYIWNIQQTTELVKTLKALRPELCVVIGGPEVSHEFEHTEIFKVADVLICGEGEQAFRGVCERVLAGERLAREHGTPTLVLRPEMVNVTDLVLPYSLLTPDDLKNRLVYFEASRGCPFTCEFCLSSLDTKVRYFDEDQVYQELSTLIERGARKIKFVDRTFNLKLAFFAKMLRFALPHARAGVFFHFEIIPDRLNEEVLNLLKDFPEEVIQFEVGIQTFDPVVGARIGRRQNLEKTLEYLKWLRANTQVSIHADLIAGLPGETMEGFGRGFDQLVRLNPQEIQLGILKRLHGVTISRHDREWGQKYLDRAPYEILENNVIDFKTFQRLKRFARFWELYRNSGRFNELIPKIWDKHHSPFEKFMEFSDFVYAQAQETFQISLERQTRYLNEFLAKQEQAANG